MCLGTLKLAIEGKGARTLHCGDQEDDGRITWKVWPEPGREPQQPRSTRRQAHCKAKGRQPTEPWGSNSTGQGQKSLSTYQ